MSDRREPPASPGTIVSKAGWSTRTKVIVASVVVDTIILAIVLWFVLRP